MRWTALLAALLALAGCRGDGGDEDLVVFAASSLTGVADALDPGAEVVFGGSNDLAAQIRDGAEADVVLSASGKPLEELRTEQLVGAPFIFASNRLVVVVPAANPGGVTGAADLAHPGLKLVLGAEGVPVGDYARESLQLAGLGGALANVVSLEEDVKGVLGKVALGEADAGIVYATDSRAAAGDVRPVAIPDELQPDVRYYAAAVEPPSDAARAYLDRLLGPEGEEALRAAGFLPLS